MRELAEEWAQGTEDLSEFLANSETLSNLKVSQTPLNPQSCFQHPHKRTLTHEGSQGVLVQLQDLQQPQD